MPEWLCRHTRQKNIVLGVAILSCLALCAATGFPALPCTRPGLRGELDGEMLRLFCRENLFAVTFFFFTVVSGIVAVGLGISLRNVSSEDGSFVDACRNVGIFAILSGVWILTDSTFLTLFIGDRDIISFLSFLSFMLMPLPLIRYFDLMLPGLQKLRVVDWAISANLLAFLGMSALKMDALLVIVPLGIHHGLILYVIAVVSKRMLGAERRRGRRLPVGLAVFLLFSLTAIVLFLLGRVALYSVFYGIALIGLITTVFYRLMKRMIDIFENQAELDRFKEMAFTDALCRIGNRSAFQMEQEATEDAPGLCYVMLDLNGLKQVNDRLGHSVGDYLIHSAAHVIQNTFADTGNCFRIGGDEFVVICTGMDEQGIRDVLERLQNAIEQHNRDQEIPLSLAWGYALRKTPEDTADALFARADEGMYVSA